MGWECTLRSSDLGARAAERMAQVIGSWRFLGVQSFMLAAWVMLNITAFVRHWDPYPFVLCNLALSFQAAYATPVLLMASNRTEERDRSRIEAILRLAESNDRTMDQMEHLLAESVELLHRLAHDEEKKGSPDAP